MPTQPILNHTTDQLEIWKVGNIRAEMAMATIASFEAKLNKVQDEYELVCRAKEALDLDLVRHTCLEPIFEELRDLIQTMPAARNCLLIQPSFSDRMPFIVMN
jgi:hypothetical protein